MTTITISKLNFLRKKGDKKFRKCKDFLFKPVYYLIMIDSQSFGKYCHKENYLFF